MKRVWGMLSTWFRRFESAEDSSVQVEAPIFDSDTLEAQIQERELAAFANRTGPEYSAWANQKGLSSMKYTSIQINCFRQFARECFSVRPGQSAVKVDIHIDEGGMHAEQPGHRTHTHILDPQRIF